MKKNFIHSILCLFFGFCMLVVFPSCQDNDDSNDDDSGTKTTANLPKTFDEAVSKSIKTLIGELKTMEVGKEITKEVNFAIVQRTKISEGLLTELQAIHEAFKAILLAKTARTYLINVNTGYLITMVLTNFDNVTNYLVMNCNPDGNNITPLYFSTNNNKTGVTDINMSKILYGATGKSTIQSTEKADGSIIKIQTIFDEKSQISTYTHTTVTPTKTGRIVNATSSNNSGKELLELEIDYITESPTVEKEIYIYKDNNLKKKVKLTIILENGKENDAKTEYSVEDL